jgi:peroxiredoxin
VGGFLLWTGCSNIPEAGFGPRSVKAAVKPDKDRKTAPEFALKDSNGQTVHLTDYKGKVVLLDFWATWCGPCRAELPNVLATYKEFHSRGFEIIGISLDQDKAQMLKFAELAGMTWPQYFDGKDFRGEMTTRFGINGIPTMWLLDKKGMVRSTEARGPNLPEQVKMLLAE